MDEGSGLCKALRAGLAWANTYTLLAIISNKKFISEGMQTGAGGGVLLLKAVLPYVVRGCVFSRAHEDPAIVHVTNLQS